MLGQDYEGQAARLRSAPTCDAQGQPRGCVLEAAKAKYIAEFTKGASEAYDKILTRYPIMDYAEEAKKRLVALHQPVPRPTKAQVARNKAEDDSRHEATMADRLMGLMKKGPDTSEAATTGEPTLVEKLPVAASDVVRQETMSAMGAPSKDNDKLAVTIINKPAASSDATSDNAAANPFGRPAGPAAAATDPNELKPTAADSNELTPTDTANAGDNALPPPPPQVNELADQQTATTTTVASAQDGAQPASDKDISSSRKKKKKGLRRFNPF